MALTLLFMEILFDGGSGGAEPGNVLVSENGEKWYSLAGSFSMMRSLFGIIK